MGALPERVREDELISKWKLVRVAYIIPIFGNDDCAPEPGEKWVKATRRYPA